jgi:hypothetical protein
MSDAVLDSMERDGWTPSQVRALVAAYRELAHARQHVIELAQHWLDSESPRAQACGEQLLEIAMGAET